MANKVNVDDLASEISGILTDYIGLAPEAFEAAGKAAAKAAVKKLKATSPSESGEYAKNWKAQTTKTRTGASTVIYQGKKPGLPHLLEFGHPIVSGGRTVGQAKAFPHIADAERDAKSIYESELIKQMEAGS